ncbi:hypothetical protein CPC08DRAFT_719097 [Agrocybe pediades]|nr:hypothetical protein CPC08DRAFT_719097 [Agrocybe pediades]
MRTLLARYLIHEERQDTATCPRKGEKNEDVDFGLRSKYTRLELRNLKDSSKNNITLDRSARRVTTHTCHISYLRAIAKEKKQEAYIQRIVPEPNMVTIKLQLRTTRTLESTEGYRVVSKNKASKVHVTESAYYGVGTNESKEERKDRKKDRESIEYFEVVADRQKEKGILVENEGIDSKRKQQAL